MNSAKLTTRINRSFGNRRNLGESGQAGERDQSEQSTQYDTPNDLDRVADENLENGVPIKKGDVFEVTLTPFFTIGTFVQIIFSDDERHIPLKRWNSEICEHSIFFNY